MKTVTAVSLWLVLAFSNVAMWNHARWVVSVSEVGAFAIAALALVACAAGWQRLTLSPVMLPLAAVTLWGLLQLQTGDTVYAWHTKVAVLYWAANFAVFFAALQAFADARVRRSFLYALLLFGFAIAVLGQFQSLDPASKVFWIFDPSPDPTPQFGPFPYKNQYAAFVEILLPFALFRAVVDEKRVMLHALIVAALYTSVIAASSRMGFFLATAEMLIVPPLVMRQRRIPLANVRTAAVTLAVVMIMLAAAAGPATLVQKFELRDPYAARTQASLVMIRDRPLLGFGLGNWATAYPGYATRDLGLYINQAHDDWAQWAAEGGLPFAALMLAIAAWSARRAFRTGWGLGVVAVFVHCLVDYPIQRTGVAFVFFAMLGAIAADERRETVSAEL
jgi:O-antigen ligase